ncbi:hypothetical protein BPJM79_30076 [Bacillus pumilus]
MFNIKGHNKPRADPKRLSGFYKIDSVMIVHSKSLCRSRRHITINSGSQYIFQCLTVITMLVSDETSLKSHIEIKSTLHQFKGDTTLQKERGFTISHPIAIPLTT